jgi:hypothetical protein
MGFIELIIVIFIGPLVTIAKVPTKVITTKTAVLSFRHAITTPVVNLPMQDLALQ